MLNYLVLCLTLTVYVQALQLPSYIKPCARTRPDFKQCALKSGREAIPFLVKGDPKYHIESMIPLRIKQLTKDSGSGAFKMNTKLTNLKIWGIPKVVLEDVDVDFKKQVLKYTCLFPRNVIEGNYHINGRMLSLPITGQGKMNITFEKFRVANLIRYTLKTKPDGKKYAVYDTPKVKITTEKAHFKFDNLFNGDKLLGRTMNQLMNDNWRLMFEEFGPTSGNFLGSLFKTSTLFLSENFPFDVLYPPKMSSTSKYSTVDRQLQALSVFGVGLCGMLLGPAGVFLVLYLLSTRFYWLSLLYIVFRIRDRHITDHGGRPYDWVRRWSWWKHCRDYFPINVIKTAELDLKKNHFICTFPHGIFSYGAMLGFGTEHYKLKEKFRGIRFSGGTTRINMMLPLLRELFLSIGCCSASRESLNYLLSDPGKGSGVVLVVGGVAECVKSKPGIHELVLKNRKGFIKLALQNGSTLVPTYVFGETDVFEQWPNPEGSWLRWTYDVCRQLFGFPPVIPRGSGFLGLMPKRTPINVVVGKPIDVEKVVEPTNEQINEIHKKFVDNLVSLFEEEKHKYLHYADCASLIIN